MGRRITLLGSVSGQQALIIIERAALPTAQVEVENFMSRLINVKNLQWNDICKWGSFVLVTRIRFII